MAANSLRRVIISPTAHSWCEAATEYIRDAAASAITAHGSFGIALAGGQTPEPVYQLLASSSFVTRIDWQDTTCYWSDERCVPPDNPSSNYGMAKRALLSHVPIPANQIHRIPGEIDPARAAAQYESTLRGSLPHRGLDLILLGMGSDGHTASLFPGTLPVQETARWVLPNRVPATGAQRVTMTPVIINSAAKVLIMVRGREKASRVAEALGEKQIGGSLPVQQIQPVGGELVWLIDAEAAGSLPSGFAR